MTMLGSIAGAFLVLFASSACATPLCRWVDSSGRTHFAAVVPEKYSKHAVCTDSQHHELLAEQREAAEAKAADEKARARRAAARPPAGAASSAAPPVKAVSQAAAKRPAEIVTDATDCATAWRLYDESVACFGPYRTTRGATKAEGFDRCNVVMSPEPRCGPRRD